MQTFFLAMALNPNVVKKAQEELDRVVGKDHLPEFSDKDDLPYINAGHQQNSQTAVGVTVVL